MSGVHVEREGPRPERRPENWEVQRGNRSGIDPQEVKAEITELWHVTDSGAGFRTALAQHGYVLARGDRRDFLVIDPAGHEHSLARRISGAKAKDIRERLADIDRTELPSVGDGRVERKADKERVQQAMQQGADKKNIERAINAGHTAEIVSAPQEDDGGETQRQRILEEQALGQRRKPEDTLSPSREETPPGWHGRTRHEREPEMSR